MADYLRFTPAEHAAISGTMRPAWLVGSFADFRRRLAAGLRAEHPALADRLAGLPTRLVRVLRMYLAGTGRAADEGGLTFREWRAVSGAFLLVLLRDEGAGSMRDRLVAALREDEPMVAAKLEALSEYQAATMCRRLRAGKRWCG